MTWRSPAANYSEGYQRDLALDGSTLYVGGSFTQVGGIPRTRLAAFDATTGTLLPWSPSVGGQSWGGGVERIGAVNGQVALGGYFQSVGGMTKRGLASFDLATGRPTPVQPPDAFDVKALTASGDLVVAATSNLSAGFRVEIFAYSAATGIRYPKTLEAGLNNVSSLAISGSTLFIGGGFETIERQPRRHLAAYDLATGQLMPWNPSPDDAVTGLKVAGSMLYVVGRFNSLQGTGRSRAAAFDLASLQLNAWNPNLPSIGIYGLDVWQNRVFLGIHVRQIVGLPTVDVVRTVAVDRFSGDLLNLDVPVGPYLAQASGTVAVAGLSNNLTPSMTLYAFDGASGQPSPWAPAATAWLQVGTIGLIGLDDHVVLTGAASVGNRPISNLAVFKPRLVLPGAPRQIQMTVIGSTVSLAWSPGAAPAPLGYVIEAGSARAYQTSDGSPWAAPRR